MLDRLDLIAAEHRELTRRLTDPAVLGNPAELMRCTQRMSELKPVVDAYEAYTRAVRQRGDAEQLFHDSSAEPELRDLAADELRGLNDAVARMEQELKQLLVPRDPNDRKNAVLEIRAGTGGEEAALFAADLYRMYARFAERTGWSLSEIDRNETGLGGIKEVIAVVEGAGAFSRLKYESGVHRVQRVPTTEASGRIHTSAATVAVLPEVDEVEIDINPGDLRIDTYRSSGAGGQHVNKTESAIRITHIPSGIVVTSQDERSQHKNKAKALRVLRARLNDAHEASAHAERAAQRKSMVGSGDRSERIRTYNFPQNRVTDHRIELTLYKLDKIMDGEVDELVDALAAADAAAKLAAQERGDR